MIAQRITSNQPIYISKYLTDFFDQLALNISSTIANSKYERIGSNIKLYFSCYNFLLIHEVVQGTMITAKKRQTLWCHWLPRSQHFMPISSYRALLSTMQNNCQLNKKSSQKQLKKKSNRHKPFRPHFLPIWSTTRSNLPNVKRKKRKNGICENVNGWIINENNNGYTAGKNANHYHNRHLTGLKWMNFSFKSNT